MNRIFLIMLLPILVQKITFAQGSGEPFYLETANGAKYIHSTGHRLLWENPDTVVYNVIYFNEDSLLVSQLDPSVIILDGSPSTVYNMIYLNTVEPLDWSTKYFWRVVEYYESTLVESPVYSFKTMSYPYCEFLDVFENGLNNWTISNDGGNCVWESVQLNSRPYTLPNSAFGFVLSADANLCGNGTSTVTTVTLNTPVTESSDPILISFDNDWRIMDTDDAAYVEVSSDGGQNWEIVWSAIGFSVRNTQVSISVNGFSGATFVRFRTIQPGWDWWWAIDNVYIKRDNCPLTQFYPPFNLLVHTLLQPSARVELSWSRGQFSDLFHIERKNGLPTDTTTYSLLGWVSPIVTNFIDTTAESNQVYTYRIYSMGAKFSNEATAYVFPTVPVELISFNANTIDNDIFLHWTTAIETNNHGFEILRKVYPANVGTQNNNNEWKTIGYVEGHGTTTEPQFYSFIDASLQPGKYQYRLKQIDFDGTSELSNVLEVTIDLPINFSLEQNFPNPFNPSTTIKYQLPKTSLVTIKVFDVLGNEIATLVNEELPAGEYEVEFDASGLTSGVYFYKLTSGDDIETRKMILIK